MKKSKFIEQLKEGERIEDVFLVKSSRLAETRVGKPYLILDLVDKSGQIGGPVWDNAEQIAQISPVGGFVYLRAQVQSYRDKLQLRIENIQAVDKNEVDLTDFVPSTTLELDEMTEQVQKMIAGIENRWVRKLLSVFFNDEEIWLGFQKAPAAKGIHHAYIGGLLEHCLSMAKVADMLAGHYIGVDRSLLLAGVLLHDIGKLKELQENVGLVDYTSTGRLKGHLVIGSEMVAQAAGTIQGFPEDLLVQIQHMILSHHGKLEFGSPTLPMTTEAVLLSYIDDLDSKMNLIEQLRRKQKEEGLQWTEYQRSLERFLYLDPLPADSQKDQNGEVETMPSMQQKLF